ncbi:MAG TPA: DUF4124 domain-containing protein [Syntrophales bacterium]|nr:DUF4124 domain-containing protein [Syntrophales bacterium]
MNGIIAVLLMLIFYLVPVVSPAAEVYIWTDKDGVTHIEDQPPRVSPQEKIKVEKHTFEKGVSVPLVVNPGSETLPAGSSPGRVDEDAAKQEVEQKARGKELQRRQAIEKARQEYEEARAQENHYVRRMKNADNAKARHYWKDKLEDIEQKRRQLEALEQAE